MVETVTPRFKLPQWSEGTDAYPGRVGWSNILKLLDGDTGKGLPGAALAFPTGPASQRPAPGTFGTFYLAADPVNGDRLSYDTGTTWLELNTNGGGGAGKPVVIGGVGSEGSSSRSARGDHTHAIPLATHVSNGAMVNTHFAMLQDANYKNNIFTLCYRDGRGGIQVGAAPVDPMDATSKQWVDAQFTALPASAKAPTYGMNPATIVWRFNAASTNPGSFDVPVPKHGSQVANKTYADTGAGDTYPTGGTVVRRWSNGSGGHVNDPATPLDIANKKYVDSKVSRQAWKTNARPFPYGLPEVLSIDTVLFDYKDDEDTPYSVRGETDVLGAYVEDIAADMPLLAVTGEDGAPERIKDRELVWVLVKAVQELSAENDALATTVSELRRDMAAVKHHLGL